MRDYLEEFLRGEKIENSTPTLLTKLTKPFTRGEKGVFVSFVSTPEGEYAENFTGQTLHPKKEIEPPAPPERDVPVVDVPMFLDALQRVWTMATATDRAEIERISARIQAGEFDRADNWRGWDLIIAYRIHVLPVVENEMEVAA